VPKSRSRLLALVAGALAIAAGVTCADGRLTGPAGSTLRAAVALVPSFSRAAAEVYRNLAAFQFTMNNVRVRLVRGNETVVVDTVVAISPGQEILVVELSVRLEKSPEVFLAKIELRDDDQVLFSGTQTITARAGSIANPPPPIELEYTGPGSEAVSLAVDPDTTILLTESVAMRAVARDADEEVVSDVLLEWSLSDATMGTLTNAGVFTAARAGTVVITAELPTGVSGSATVNVVAPPSSLTLVSGGNQTGSAGRVLEQPIVVEVRAADNLPVAGHSVTFAVTAGGGSVAPASALTGTDGRASAVLTLGPAQGVNTVQVTAAGLEPISVSATGILAAATTRHWIAATNSSWETDANWSGGLVPGARDTAVIDQAGTYVVVISSAVSVGKVVVGGASGQHALHVMGGAGTLTVSDSVRVTSTGILTLGTSGGGTVLTAGAIVIQGIAQWLGGDIAGSGNMEVTTSGSLLFSGTTALGLRNRVLQNRGLILFAGGDAGHLTLSDGARIDNLAGAEFFVQGEMDILQGSGAAGSVANHGFYRKVVGNTGAHTIGVSVNNIGTIEIYEGTLAFAGPSFVNTSEGFVRGIGTMDVSGTAFQNSGIVEPGLLSPGLLTVVGPVALQSASTVAIELGGTTAETMYDVLAVNGAVTFSGLLEVTLVNGYVPVAGDSLTVVRYSSRSGSFENLIGLNPGGGLYFDPIYTATGLSLVARQSASASVTWINAAGGNWSTGSNWSTGVAPTTTDVVAIDLTGTYTVTLDVNATIAGLIVGGASGVQTLSGTSRTLTVNGFSTVAPSGVLSLSGSTLAGTGNLTSSGSLVLQNSVSQATVTVTNQALMLAHGTVSILGPLSTSTASVVQALGQSSGGPAELTVANGFTNNGTIELTSSGGQASTLTVTNGTLTNGVGATIRSMTTGARTVAAQLNNRGYLEIDAPLTLNRADARHINSGVINLTTADLTVTQSGAAASFTNADGTISIGAARTLAVTGGVVTNDDFGLISGTGTLDVTGAAFTNNGLMWPGGESAPGIFTVTGNWAQVLPSGILRVELGGLTAGTEHDRVIISGTATFGGELTVVLINGFQPAIGNAFTIMNYNGFAGSFTSANLPTLPTDRRWQVTNGTTSFVLTVVPFP